MSLTKGFTYQINFTAHEVGMMSQMNAMNAAMSSAKSMVLGLRQSFSLARAAGMQMTIIFGAISAGMAMLAKEALETDKAFTEVFTLLNEEQRNLEGPLQDGIRDVARAFGVDLVDAADAAYQSISAGVDAGKTVKFVGEAAKLATAGMTTLSNSVDGVTAVMNAYGHSNISASEASDLLFSIIKGGKTTAAELFPVINRSAVAAANFGVSTDVLGASMGTLTKITGNASESSTQFRRIIESLVDPGDQAKKVFEELGIEYGTSAVEGDNLTDTLIQIKDATQGDMEALKKLIPNKRAFNGIINLLSNNMQNYNAQLEIQADRLGIVAAAYDRVMESTAKQYEMLGNNINLLKERGGALVLEAFEPMVRRLVDWTDKADKAAGETSVLAEKLTFLTGIVAVVGTTFGGTLATFAQFGFMLLTLHGLGVTLSGGLLVLGKAALIAAVALVEVWAVMKTATLVKETVGYFKDLAKAAKRHFTKLNEDKREFIKESTGLDLKYKGDVFANNEEIVELMETGAQKRKKALKLVTKAQLEEFLKREVSAEDLMNVNSLVIDAEIDGNKLLTKIKEKATQRRISLDEALTRFTGQTMQKRKNLIMKEAKTEEKIVEGAEQKKRKYADLTYEELRILKWKEKERVKEAWALKNDELEFEKLSEKEKQEIYDRIKDHTINLMKSTQELKLRNTDNMKKLAHATEVTGEDIGKPLIELKEQKVQPLADKWEQFFANSGPQAITSLGTAVGKFDADVSGRLANVGEKVRALNEDMKKLAETANKMGQGGGPPLNYGKMGQGGGPGGGGWGSYGINAITSNSGMNNAINALTSIASVQPDAMKAQVQAPVTKEGTSGGGGVRDVNFYGNVTNKNVADNIIEMLDAELVNR